MSDKAFDFDEELKKLQQTQDLILRIERLQALLGVPQSTTDLEEIQKQIAELEKQYLWQ